MISDVDGREKTSITSSNWENGRSPPTSGQVNTLVLLKDDHLPTTKLSVGRVVEIHPDANKMLRVTTVRTVYSQIPISKFCSLLVKAADTQADED